MGACDPWLVVPRVDCAVAPPTCRIGGDQRGLGVSGFTISLNPRHATMPAIMNSQARPKALEWLADAMY